MNYYIENIESGETIAGPMTLDEALSYPYDNDCTMVADDMPEEGNFYTKGIIE